MHLEMSVGYRFLQRNRLSCRTRNGDSGTNLNNFAKAFPCFETCSCLKIKGKKTGILAFQIILGSSFESTQLIDRIHSKIIDRLPHVKIVL